MFFAFFLILAFLCLAFGSAESKRKLYLGSSATTALVKDGTLTGSASSFITTWYWGSSDCKTVPISSSTDYYGQCINNPTASIDYPLGNDAAGSSSYELRTYKSTDSAGVITYSQGYYSDKTCATATTGPTDNTVSGACAVKSQAVYTTVTGSTSAPTGSGFTATYYLDDQCATAPVRKDNIFAASGECVTIPSATTNQVASYKLVNSINYVSKNFYTSADCDAANSKLSTPVSTLVTPSALQNTNGAFFSATYQVGFCYQNAKNGVYTTGNGYVRYSWNSPRTGTDTEDDRWYGLIVFIVVIPLAAGFFYYYSRPAHSALPKEEPPVSEAELTLVSPENP